MGIDITKLKPAQTRGEVIKSVLDQVYQDADTVKADSGKAGYVDKGEREVAAGSGKMLYNNMVVTVDDTVDGDGNVMVRDEKDDLYQVKAADLKGLDVMKEGREERKEREPGFWNTYVGDFLESLGAGVYNLNGGLWSILDKVDRVLTTIDPSARYIGKRIREKYENEHPGSDYRTWIQRQMDYSNSYAETLRKRADRYGGKDYEQLFDEGKYGSMAGQIMLTAAESAPQSVVAMAGGGAGLALTGAVAGAQKYDQLDEMPETKDMPVYLKTLNSVGAGVFESAFEKLGDVKIGKELVRLYRKVGKEQASKIVEDEISGWMTKQFKKYGLLWMPVAEGIEEVATTVSNNITDYCTGVTDKWEPLAGAGDSFVYGAGGGAQFAMAGLPGYGYKKLSKYQAKRNYNQAKENLVSQFPNEKADIEMFSNVLTFMSPAEQEAALAAMAKDPDISQKQIDVVRDFAKKAINYRDYHTPEVREQDRQAIKEAKVRIALMEFDDATKQMVNEDGLIQKVQLASMGDREVCIVKGRVAVNEAGGGLQVDVAKSSPELYYEDDEGKMQVTTPLQIVKVNSLTDAGALRQEVEKQLREGSHFDIESQTPQQEVERNVVENGDKIVYKNEQGEQVTGVVGDAVSNAEYVFMEDGTPVLRNEAVKTENDTVEPDSDVVVDDAVTDNQGVQVEDNQREDVPPAEKVADVVEPTEKSLPDTKDISVTTSVEEQPVNEQPEVETVPVAKTSEETESNPISAERDDNVVMDDKTVTPVSERVDDGKTYQGKQAATVGKAVRKPERASNESKLKPEVREKPVSDFGNKNKLVTRERYQELLRKWREKTEGQLNAGFDPEVLAIGTEMAMFHIEAGARKFVDFSKSMINDIGESIRPYLRAIYEGAKYMPGMENLAKDMDLSDFVSKFNVDEIGKETVASQVSDEERSDSQVGGVADQPKSKSRVIRGPKDFSSYMKEGLNRFPVKKYSTDGIDHELPSVEVAKVIKKDVTRFVKALQNVLGWEFDTDAKGKIVYCSVQLPPAGGEATFILWKPGTDAGIYAHIDYKPDEYSNNYAPAERFMYRVTTRENKYRGENNQYYRTDASVFELSEVFEKAVSSYLENINGNEDGGNDRNRSLPDTGGQDKNVVDAGIHATGDVSDVQERHTEKLSDTGSRASSRREGEGNRSRDELDRSAGDNERNGVVPDEGETEAYQATDGGTDRGNRGISGNAVVKNSRNYVIADPRHMVPRGRTAKIRANIAAIRLLKQIESEGRTATAEEQKMLSQYTGWGGLAEVLNKDKAVNANWQKENGAFYKEIVELLTEDEYLSAVNSTINAHYTSGGVVASLWELAERLGFKGGKVLEPAAGVGNFLGLMPAHLSGVSNIVAYELDSITGRILEQLYPDARVNVAGYETSNDRAFDLILTNVPFGHSAPYDSGNKDLTGFSLHNYFIAKGIKQLKPGGLGIFITSYSTLDSGASAKFREWVTSDGSADFIGAIRLPNNAFAENAGTEVTTDILVFRKRDAGGISPYAQSFRYSMPIKEAKKQNGDPVTIDVNEYFVAHPDMMLGEPFLAYEVNKGGLYSADDFTLHPRVNEDLMAALKDAIGKFDTDITELLPSEGPIVELAEKEDQEGTLIFRDGGFREVVNGELVVPAWVNENVTDLKKKKVSKKEVARLYVEIRETVNQLVDAELNDRADMEVLRSRLNEQYNVMVSRFGHFYNNLKLRFLCDSDVGWCNVFALEKVDTKYVDDGRGKLKRKFIIEKADIFKQRISFPVDEPVSASSLEDALNISVAYRGKLDLAYVGKLLDLPEDAVKAKILDEGFGFENPVTGLIEDRDSYLSEFVRQKLYEAKEAATKDERFAVNVAALEKVIPADIPASQIRIKLGSVFIPGEYVERFVEDKLEVKARIRYLASLNKWVIDHVENSSNPKNTKVYGTQRISGLDLIEKSLNMSQPVIYDVSLSNGKKVQEKNLEETAAAQAKMAEIETEFVNYIADNKEFMKVIARLYNDKYNNYVEKKYTPPTFDHFPGANTNITLRQHQKKAVGRCLKNCTLLAHEVGSGKTFTMITAAMEMRRLKIARKPMIVVQNQTIEQFVASFKILYPAAKVLSPSKSQMDAKNRMRLLNLISYGDYDAIVVPQSFMSMIPDNTERQKAYIKEQISEVSDILSEVDPEEDKTLHSQLKSQLESLEDMLEDLNGEQDEKEGDGKTELVKNKAKRQLGITKRIMKQADRKVDHVRTFEQLGVDALFIDEAHAYKKLGLTTKLANIRGIDKGASKRAFSMFMKVRYVQEITGGKNVVFATGTPITNTVAELWTMLRFIAPDILQKYDIERFDEFASVFGSVEPSLEFTAAGTFKVVERFKSYINVPELIKAFRAKTDVVLSDDIPEFKEGNTIPKLKNGQFTQIIIKQSDGLKKIMSELRNILERWEKLPGREKRKKRHIPLVIFNRAKQAAIDLRLLNPEYEDDPGSKLNRLVDEVVRIHKETEKYRGTQLIFCDMYLSPENHSSNYPRFNLFRDIKVKLIAKGIPENEIAIVNEYKDSQRELLFEKIKNGEIREVLGTTADMGVGVNVQDLLAALHHVDAPPRPMDFTQRNGRILRQGNTHAIMGLPVEILTYGVEKTLDATAYQRLAIKQGFINQMMHGENLGREMEDVASEDSATDLNFSQMMATLSGSQYAMLHQQRSYELKKLEMAEKNFHRRQIELNKEIQHAEDFILKYNEDEKAYNKVYETLAKGFPDKKLRGIIIDGKVYTEKLGEAIEKCLEKFRKDYEKSKHLWGKKIGLLGTDEFITLTSTFMGTEQIYYELSIKCDDLNISSWITTGQGLVNSFNRLLAGALEKKIDFDVKKKKLKDQIVVMESELKKPFDKAEKLIQLRQEVAELEEKMKQEVIHETGIDSDTAENEDIDEDTGVEDDFPEQSPDMVSMGQDESGSEVQADTQGSENTDSGEMLALPPTQTKHTKTGEDLFVVKLGGRVDRSDFDDFKRIAKKYKGGWSNFTHGFTFYTAEDAERFRDELNGKGGENRDAFFREVELNDPDLPHYQRESAKIFLEAEKFKRRLGIDFKVIGSRGELPGEVYGLLKSESRYPGVYVVRTGEAYIILDEVENVQEVQRAILHEVVGHKGIRGLMGSGLKKFTENVLKAMNEKERTIWLNRFHGNRELATQEYVAGFAEGYAEPTYWNRIKAVIRNYFRQAGIELKLTDADLRYVLWRGVKKLQTGRSVIDLAQDAVKDVALFNEAELSEDVYMDTSSALDFTDIDKVKLHNEINSRSFRFLEAYQDRMLAVKKLQEMIELSIGKKIPDYMNVYIYENTLASRNTYETEFFRNNCLKPLVRVIATLENRGLSRQEIENYVLVKHGLERNDFMRKREVDKWFVPAIKDLEFLREIEGEEAYQEKLNELEKARAEKLKEMEKVDFAGVSVIADELPDADVLGFIQKVEANYEIDVKDLWDSIRAATDFSLKKWFDSGMMDRKKYEYIKGMYQFYVPLRGFSETIASDVYEYFTEADNAFNSPLRFARGRRSKADTPFAYIVSMAESAIIGGNKNLMKLHLYRLAQKYPSGLMSINKVWYMDSGVVDENGEPLYEAVFPEYDENMDTYRKNVDAFNKRMAALEKEGKAYKNFRGLKVGLRMLNTEPEEHIVRVCLNGQQFGIMVHGDPRVAQAVNGLNDEERTKNRVVNAIRMMNRQMAANFTTRNPAFVMSNMTRDLIFSMTALSVKEGARYRNRFMVNIPKASRAVGRYLRGKPDMNNAIDRHFEEFLKNGGETGYTALHNIEKFKKIVDREIQATRRNKILEAGISILDYFEMMNRWAEDLARFSTYLTSRQMGRSVLRSVADAKEVTVNFNRKGSGAKGAQVFKSLYLFFNAAVQSLANCTDMVVKHPRRAATMITGYAMAGAIVPLLLAALGGDDDLKEYLNLPDYVRKNNLCIYLGAKRGFVTIPLPIELRAFYGWGDAAFRYLCGDTSGVTAAGEVITGMLDLLPLNPVGGGSPYVPDALKPISESFYVNRDFTGRPIAKVTDYNKYVPEYQRVYRGTSEFFVKSSEVLNDLTGGDYAKRGAWDEAGRIFSSVLNTEVNVTNPAAWEHLFEAYLGGMFTTLNQAVKSIEGVGEWAITGNNKMEARNIPVLNRFYNTGSVFSSQAKTNQKYFEALDEMRQTESQIRRYKDAMANGEMNMDKALDGYLKLEKEGKLDRLEVIKFYAKEVGKLNDAIMNSGLPDNEADALRNELYLLKEQMLDELKKVGKSE